MSRRRSFHTRARLALELLGARVAPSVTAVGAEFLVNSTSQEEQIFPAIAMDDEGNSVVVWQSPDGSGYGIFAQMYDSSGTPVGT